MCGILDDEHRVNSGEHVEKPASPALQSRARTGMGQDKQLQLDIGLSICSLLCTVTPQHHGMNHGIKLGSVNIQGSW